MELRGKRLLIMGGAALSCDIVNKAKKIGIYTIVTDWHPKSLSPAKKISDQSFMVSISDVDAIVDLIRQESIDGVITGFTDSTLQYYQKVCEKAGLPCYLTAEQISITTDKGKFKSLCNLFDLPIVEEYQIDDISNLNQLKSIRFPVIVKPADNSGGRGITLCKNQQGFIEAYKRALAFSENKSVIVERYMKSKEATIFYLIHDGEIFLTGIGDRHTKDNQKDVIPLPVAYTFPSCYLDTYLDDLNYKVVEMFKSIGMKNGMIFIQSFVEKGKFIFYEMGYRLTGSLEYKIMEPLIGVDPLELMIKFAITGEMGEVDTLKKLNPKWDSYSCNITFLAKPGQIKTIKGIEEVLSFTEVVDAFPSYKEGDVIPENAKGTLQQVVLRVFAIAKTKNHLIEVMDRIHEAISVTSIDDDDMLLDKFNTMELLYEKN